MLRRFRHLLSSAARSPTFCAVMASSSAACTWLTIPEGVRGMITLDKSAFEAKVRFPVIGVAPTEISRLRGCTDKYVVKNLGRKIKPIVATDDPQRKLIVMNPNVVNDEKIRDEIIAKVRDVSGDSNKEWETHEFTVGFDDWDMKSIFRAVLPEDKEYSSFTQTGHLVHCNFRDDLVPYRTIIGQILLAKIPTCRTVVYKPDLIATKFRTFHAELIAGDEDYVVETVEDGVRYKMDFTKVFWNSRLSHEHGRVLTFITRKSLVFDACAGIGPFAIPAAKKKCARLVWANDLNPDSVHWMKENIKLNKLPSTSVEVFNEDAAAFIRGPVAKCLREQMVLPVADRPDAAHIIMNLPALAVTFLPAFRGMLRTEGESSSPPAEEPFPIIVYCYMFAKAQSDVPDEWYGEKARAMTREQLRWEAVQIRKAHNVRTVSNNKEMVCVECVLPWELLFASPLTDEEEKIRNEQSIAIAAEQEDEEEIGGDGDGPPSKKIKN